ncbi:glycosyltransferase [Telmatospirillum sp.]|uniref:glycosyltransferase n=1 Tax=Telmatospirillum sp. TaxID=2079197 RepID=UPI00284E146B|nr:glycosyltransferase [Telmatospirillum sp.]MDR3439303.1 glycosyltransferase [Telmatospirillum sp.]
MSGSFLLAWLAALSWAWMLLQRGRFWLIERPVRRPDPSAWPAVTAVIPARDEALVIGSTVRSLLEQDYPGLLRIVVTDDHSTDGTAEAARQAALALNAEDRLLVVPSAPLPAGWSGKLWAQSQAVTAAEKAFPESELWLLGDADIAHAPGELRSMVARLLADGLDMASLMVRLSTSTFAEKTVVPAFVFFFRLLYPFRWVADPLRTTAAAAGGYMLIRRSMLTQIGGLASIRSALIDDCTLARKVKDAAGRITLDLALATTSTRIYQGFGGLWMMIARSAYTQLRCSPLLLAGTVIAMIIAFLLPPLFVLCGSKAWFPGALAWIEMSLAFGPMLRFYRMPLILAPLLPLVALFYLAATVDSARRHWSGRGGEWKGRVQAATEPGRES